MGETRLADVAGAAGAAAAEGAAAGALTAPDFACWSGCGVELAAWCAGDAAVEGADCNAAAWVASEVAPGGTASPRAAAGGADAGAAEPAGDAAGESMKKATRPPAEATPNVPSTTSTASRPRLFLGGGVAALGQGAAGGALASGMGAGSEFTAGTAAGIGSVRVDVGARAESGTVSIGIPSAVGALDDGPMPPGPYGTVGSVYAASGCVRALVGTVIAARDWLGGTNAGCSGRVRSSREASRAVA